MNKYILDANLSAHAPYNVILVMSLHHRYTIMVVVTGGRVLPPPPISCQPKN